MGAITRSIANNITTSGVFTSSAINNASVTGITVLPNAEDGITLISSQTASSSASISFTTGLDSTYKAYKFVFINIHAQTSTSDFTMNLSTDSGSNYNVTKTTTYFFAFNLENDTSTGFGYRTESDLAQSTAFQPIAHNQGDDNDGSLSGYMSLFNPSSTTYVKHFMSTVQHMGDTASNFSGNRFMAGYANTTSAINAIQFKMSSGNIDAGTIYLYGIK